MAPKYALKDKCRIALIYPNMQQDQLGWRVSTPSNTHYRFRYSLKEDAYNRAFYFALTVGSLPREEILEFHRHYVAERILDTGVPGMFIQKGLKEKFLVIIEGRKFEFPYDKGKGFKEASRKAAEMLSESVKLNMEQYEIKPILFFE